MLLVGLTGGIGSGKSTVARMLQDRGAIVFDADILARAALDPGTPGHRAVVEGFGSAVVSSDGSIDREALGRVVFADEAARRRLEAVVHPEVFRLLAEGVASHRDTDHVVVFDAPLIVETGFAASCDVVLLVTAPEVVRLARLVAQRGMSWETARARIAAQMSDDEKRRRAHIVIENEGSIEELERRVDEVWASLRRPGARPA